MDFQNFLALSLYFLFLFYLPDPSHSPIQLPGWLGDKKMYISLYFSVWCVCVCENATSNGFNFIRFFIGNEDQCLKLKNSGFFKAFYPNHPRSLSMFILVNFKLWWYGCGLVVVVGRRWRRWRFVVLAVWLVGWLAGTEVADEGTVVGCLASLGLGDLFILIYLLLFILSNK